MNTKFSFVLLMIVIALVAAACAPAVTVDHEPLAAPLEPTVVEVIAIVPVTGEKAADSADTNTQETRMWSGEVFLSNNDAPDNTQNTNSGSRPHLQSACMSEEDQPRRHGGCIE